MAGLRSAMVGGNVARGKESTRFYATSPESRQESPLDEAAAQP